MSNEQEHIEEHVSPIKTPKQLITTVVLAFVVPIIIIMLVNVVTSGTKVGAGSDTLGEEAVAKRIAPVAGFELVDANAPKVHKTGEQVFTAVCTACHTAGVAGAPKMGDNAAWAPFIKAGYDAMLNVALHGKGGMPAKGGNPALSDYEVARAAAAPAEQQAAVNPAGEKLYKATCFACHATGVANAPKFGDKAAWAPYIQTGMDAMLKVAMQGKGAMPPKGGAATASEDDIRAAIEYMVNAAK